MKKILQAFLIVILTSCAKDNNLYKRELLPEEQNKISAFEKNYVDRLSRNVRTKSNSPDDILLVGYKTISYHGSDSVFVNDLWEKHKEEIAAFGSFLTLDGQARIYFPMSDAIVFCNGTKYIADSNGAIACSNHKIDKVQVVGRNRTEKTIFTSFNHPYIPHNIFYRERVLFFDLGSRPLICSMDENNVETLYRGEGGNSGGISCTQNHGTYPNCTVAYMIAQPRCVTNYYRCMDYNGFGTDCSGSKLFFLGSDCSVALSMGFCWNEVMD